MDVIKMLRLHLFLIPRWAHRLYSGDLLLGTSLDAGDSRLSQVIDLSFKGGVFLLKEYDISFEFALGSD